MTTILRSIHPQHIVNIVAGLKTNEVRTKVPKPKCKIPYKVLVYCTSVKNLPLQLYADLHLRTGGAIDDWSGKVIGEYICDAHPCYGWDYDHHGRYSCSDEELATTCLTREELNEYGEYGKALFFEHITGFKLYDRPRDIGEFIAPCPTMACVKCKHFQDNMCIQPVFSRPPQSFYYAEEA